MTPTEKHRETAERLAAEIPFYSKVVRERVIGELATALAAKDAELAVANARAERQWAGWVKEEALRKAAEAQLAEANKALEPFSVFAGPLFERNFNRPDVVARVSASDGGVVSITAGDFFDARAARRQSSESEK